LIQQTFPGATVDQLIDGYHGFPDQFDVANFLHELAPRISRNETVSLLLNFSLSVNITEIAEILHNFFPELTAKDGIEVVSAFLPELNPSDLFRAIHTSFSSPASQIENLFEEYL
jgi:hypothetical protein